MKTYGMSEQASDLLVLDENYNSQVTSYPGRNPAQRQHAWDGVDLTCVSRSRNIRLLDTRCWDTTAQKVHTEPERTIDRLQILN